MRWPALSVLMVLVCVSAFGDEPAVATSRVARFTILHSGDIHGHLLPAGKEGSFVGGMARIAGYARTERAIALEENRGVVLLDAGDIFTGTPEGGATTGLLAVSAMGRAGYELACVGNHEFDFGVAHLAELASEAVFPLIGANVLDVSTGRRVDWLKDFVVLELGGVRVAFIGLVSAESAMGSGGTRGVSFADEDAALLAGVAAAREAGAQLCVGVTHVGLARDKELAGLGREVALLIGSHSHSVLPHGWRNADTGVWVAHAGCNGKWLGRVDVEVELDGVAVRSIRCEPSLARLNDSVAVAKDVAAYIEEQCVELHREMDEVVGELATGLARSGPAYAAGSSPLGNFVTDAMRIAAGAELAMQNRTGIRANLPTGRVTKAQVYEACPFDNTVVAMDLAGSNVVALLDRGLSGKNRFLLELSGGEVEYDPGADEGRRICALRVGGVPVDSGRMYRLATCSFLANGGDGHLAFLLGSNVVDTGRMVRDVVGDALSGAVPLKVEHRNRIIERKACGVVAVE